MKNDKLVIILGSTGMLGYAVTKYFVENTNFDLIYTTRDIEGDALLRKRVDFVKFAQFPRSITWERFNIVTNEWLLEGMLGDFTQLFRDRDVYLINCIGLIKPYCDNTLNAIYTNSQFSHVLSNVCSKRKIKLLQIATDCVYSGNSGQYTEENTHDATDVYGRTKSLGESSLAMNIRTSIIGEELKGFHSLLEWTKKQTECVNGFVNHYWNGLTTKEFAKICNQIINENLYEAGTFHIHSRSKTLFADEITKEYLVSLIKEKYDLKIKINKYETLEKCDRSLRTSKSLMKNLKINSIEEQINEL